MRVCVWKCFKGWSRVSVFIFTAPPAHGFFAVLIARVSSYHPQYEQVVAGPRRTRLSQASEEEGVRALVC